MQPSRYRGRLAAGSPAANNYGLQLVLQASAVTERNKQFECRINKEQSSLHSKLVQHDTEKNYPSKQDGRLASAFVHHRQNYSPIAANVTDIFVPEMRHGKDSVVQSTVAGRSTSAQLSSNSRGRTDPENTFVTAATYKEDTELPKGDRVTSSRSVIKPGIPVVLRTAEERAASPDKLNLERQNLTMCPIIEGEEQIHLLNLQHNFISRIQNLSNLQRLIFLDLYDNQIEEICGLSGLRALRVLMLGKNRIRKITNLEKLEKLDVLDLHGNQITKIENVCHLGQLRVLNLARNFITVVENLNGLDSLAELNLRHNEITSVKDVDALPSLEHLFLSFNNISCFQDILCLSDSTSLSDITLDGNPIAQESWYKQTILCHMLQLRQLDMKRITEEERRTASVLARKEEEKKRESHKLALMKEKKRIAICNAARLWERQQNRAAHIAELNQESRDSDVISHKPSQINGSAAYPSPEENRSLDSLLSSAVQGLNVIDSHLVELEGDTLHLYGPGALESLERTWSVQTTGTVTTISFTFIDFDEISQVLPKLKMKFPNSSHLKFKETNLTTLQQFNALAQVRRLEQLTVDPQGNPVVNFTLWKYYVLFRLKHFNVQKINQTEVTPNDLIMAERLFGILAHVASSRLPQYRLLHILGESKKKQLCNLLDSKSKKPAVSGEESIANTKVVGENQGREIMNYTIKVILTERLEGIRERSLFCRTYVQDLVKEATDISTKNESLQRLWPQMFIELVRDAVIEVRDKDSYMKLCLQRILDQK
ncbi:leucine-rich repeat-containing protein 49 isoform X1 [Pleurodeles waltl]|uniref:leucine-rich repeat-containing protein 49 isoform X1 n=1 Tax=Pleurodeles waltl TaxID=8319 RepID=UPI0037098CA4